MIPSTTVCFSLHAMNSAVFFLNEDKVNFRRISEPVKGSSGQKRGHARALRMDFGGGQSYEVSTVNVFYKRLEELVGLQYFRVSDPSFLSVTNDSKSEPCLSKCM